jgi:hypothetical protein
MIGISLIVELLSCFTHSGPSMLFYPGKALWTLKNENSSSSQAVA